MGVPPALRVVLILLVGGLAFANGIGNPMLMDDVETITNNPQIRSLTSTSVFFPEQELPVAGRPLSNLSFALNYAFTGTSITALRLTNLALHLLCAIVACFTIERLLTLKRVPATVAAHASAVALTAALFWVVHPLNTEVINYLTQRTEALMALFYLLTVYASLRALTATGQGWTLAAAVFCSVGALCKESIATAPLVVIAVDRLLVFDSWRDCWSRRRGLYVALAASWIVLAALQATDPRPRSAGFNSGIGAWTYLLNQAVLVTRYFGLAFWPRDLVVLYGFPVHYSLVQVLPQALVIAALLGLTIVACIRWPAIGLTGIWVWLTLAPTSSILPIATEVGAERRMYLPLLAFTVLAASAVWRFSRHTLIAALLVVAMTTALGVATFARNREYANHLELAQTTLARWPSGMAHLFVGEELITAQRHDEALTHLRIAVMDIPRAHYTMGAELFSQGRNADAAAEFEAFIRAEPLHAYVPDAEGRLARAYVNLARWSEAVAVARRALAKDRRNSDARFVLAEDSFRRSEFQAAIEGYRAYLSARPSDVSAVNKLALALISAGQAEEAIATFQRAADLEPTNWQLRRNVAQALLDANRLADAAIEARRVIGMNPRDAPSHTLLGIALARTGELDAAADQFSQAIALDPSDPEPRAYLAQVRQH